MNDHTLNAAVVNHGLERRSGRGQSTSVVVKF